MITNEAFENQVNKMMDKTFSASKNLADPNTLNLAKKIISPLVKIAENINVLHENKVFSFAFSEEMLERFCLNTYSSRNPEQSLQEILSEKASVKDQELIKASWSYLFSFHSQIEDEDESEVYPLEDFFMAELMALLKNIEASIFDEKGKQMASYTLEIAQLFRDERKRLGKGFEFNFELVTEVTKKALKEDSVIKALDEIIFPLLSEKEKIFYNKNLL